MDGSGLSRCCVFQRAAAFDIEWIRGQLVQCPSEARQVVHSRFSLILPRSLQPLAANKSVRSVPPFAPRSIQLLTDALSLRRPPKSWSMRRSWQECWRVPSSKVCTFQEAMAPDRQSRRGLCATFYVVVIGHAERRSFTRSERAEDAASATFSRTVPFGNDRQCTNQHCQYPRSVTRTQSSILGHPPTYNTLLSGWSFTAFLPLLAHEGTHRRHHVHAHIPHRVESIRKCRYSSPTRPSTTHTWQPHRWHMYPRKPFCAIGREARQ